MTRLKVHIATILAVGTLLVGQAAGATHNITVQNGSFSCGNGITTQIYAPNGYDYHEVNGIYYIWGAPSNFVTTVNWGATSGSFWLQSNAHSGYLYAYCR